MQLFRNLIVLLREYIKEIPCKNENCFIVEYRAGKPRW